MGLRRWSFLLAHCLLMERSFLSTSTSNPASLSPRFLLISPNSHLPLTLSCRTQRPLALVTPRDVEKSLVSSSLSCLSRQATWLTSVSATLSVAPSTTLFARVPTLLHPFLPLSLAPLLALPLRGNSLPRFTTILFIAETDSTPTSTSTFASIFSSLPTLKWSLPSLWRCRGGRRFLLFISLSRYLPTVECEDITTLIFINLSLIHPRSLLALFFHPLLFYIHLLFPYFSFLIHLGQAH